MKSKRICSFIELRTGYKLSVWSSISQRLFIVLLPKEHSEYCAHVVFLKWLILTISNKRPFYLLKWITYWWGVYNLFVGLFCYRFYEKSVFNTICFPRRSIVENLLKSNTFVLALTISGTGSSREERYTS